MPKKSFKATQGMLRDVMTKQSGVIQKAWLEALMNGVDAEANQINFNITPAVTQYSDDGNSMVEDEIEEYFEKFGLKDEDIEDKEFGKFRMGRGQIFNFGVNIWRARQNYMVVSIHTEDATVMLDDCTASDDESIIEFDGNEYTVDTEGLEYALLEAEEVDEGISIEVHHYDEVSDIDAALDEFKKLARYVSWLHDVEVTVNGETLDEEPEVYEETKLAYFCEGYTNYQTNSAVYNKGAYVDDFDLGPKSLTIISKQDLDVTLDRTDILEHDEKWHKIKEQYEDVVLSYLEDNPDMTTTQRNWMLEKASESAGMMDRLKDVPLVEDINGDVHAVEDVAGNQFSFAESDDQLAQDAMAKSNVVMLSESQEKSFKQFADAAHEIIESQDVQDYGEVIEDKMTFEMKHIDKSKLSKRRTDNLEAIEQALRDLGFRPDIKAGYSNHKRIWKNSDDELYIHKEELNKTQQEVATEVLQKAVMVAAHQGETIKSFDEGFSHSSNVYEAIVGDKFAADVNYAIVQQRFLDGEY